MVGLQFFYAIIIMQIITGAALVVLKKTMPFHCTAIRLWVEWDQGFIKFDNGFILFEFTRVYKTEVGA